MSGAKRQDGAQLAPGDIVEVETAAGPAYAQVTHRHVSYPEVVRALERPASGGRPKLSELAGAETRFTAIVPLGAAMARGAIRATWLGSAALRPADRTFPTFKTPIRDRQGGIAYWWFWDGDGLSYSADPQDDPDRFPTREVLSAERFLARLSE